MADNGQAVQSIDVAVIGAGHSGLAMSRCLSEIGIGHVVIERGDIANAWRHERWDSLTLLTPNWQSRLPGFRYEGADLDGFMTAAEVADFICDYAAAIKAPVKLRTEVTRLAADNGRYRVETTRGSWLSRAVVIASGGFSQPAVPAFGQSLPDRVVSTTVRDYRRPAQLPDGEVLVVGASATGLQLAEEIHASGRPVTISVGEHVRMPRSYRGRDIQHWMERTGLLDERYDEVDDLTRARNVPSPQLAGTPERRMLDLNVLSDAGVRLVGRLAGVRNHVAQFSGSLRNVCALADLKMNRLLKTIDEWIDENQPAEASIPGERYDATRVPEPPCLGIDLANGPVRSVVWATGLKPDYAWVDLPVFDRKGRIRHDGGVVDSPGVYVLGLTFLRRRKSSFIHGAEDDCRELTSHLVEWLGSPQKEIGDSDPI